jgi:Fimbrial assembly protein (PilN)
MRPVNLLPPEYRAKVASGDGRSGYIALGVLGVVLVMLLGWVLTGNSLNSKKSKLAEVNHEIARDKAEAGSQSAFGDFHDIEQTRISSVTTLAGDRFDWERLVREVSLVLPAGTSLTEMNASKGPQAEGASSSATPSATPTPTDASAAGLPSLHLVGCAAKQNTVATMLVRLRQMHGVDDVELGESSEQVPESEGGGSSAPSDSASGSGSSSDGCKPKTFKFDVTVTFKQELAPQGGDRRVPARLGGGS